jgi:hypothetical protein
VGAGAFFALSHFYAREREAKKGAKARRKKSAKKVKAPSAKEIFLKICNKMQNSGIAEAPFQ